jgi:hypothetical protein
MFEHKSSDRVCWGPKKSSGHAVNKGSGHAVSKSDYNLGVSHGGRLLPVRI